MAIVQQHDIFGYRRVVSFDGRTKRGPKFKGGPASRGKKQCTKCRETKPTTAFARSKDAADGLFPQCKECVAAYDNANRDKSKASSWKRHYGLSEHVYWDLFEQQGGVCAICGQPETRLYKGTLAYLAVDHDHVTGMVRGLLCSACNGGISKFRDDTTRLERAIVYLQKSRA